MFLSEPAVLASRRWIRLLRTSSLPQAWSIIRTAPHYTDITQTQYVNALEWLCSAGVISESRGVLGLAAPLRNLPEIQSDQFLFECLLEQASPPWLIDTDIYVCAPEDVPQDAARLANLLGLTEENAFLSIRRTHGRVDLNERKQVGSAGEKALVEFLEQRWPGSTVHVALTNDGFGYDVVFILNNQEWHLEVKSTTRRGRLAIYLSRNEHEVALRDPKWRLIIVGLDRSLQLRALATAEHSKILSRAPVDVSSHARWQSSAHYLGYADLASGLSFLDDTLNSDAVRDSYLKTAYKFSWMSESL